MLQISLLVLLTSQILGVPLPGEAEFDPEVLTKLTESQLNELAGELAVEEIIRTKRSGSGDILGTVGKTISSGIGNKISLLGRASAGASSFFSGASSKGTSEHHDGYNYGPPAPAPMSYHTKSFDFWTLKKSILNTLLQAVKAITGGVTILKGQVVKGGGALLSGLGKVVSVKGEAVTNLGRHIVNSASLVPPKKKGHHHGSSSHESTGHSSPSGPAHITSYGTTAPSGHYGAPAISSHYGAPTAPAVHYGAPTAPSAHYGAPPSHVAHYEAPQIQYYGAPVQHNSVFGAGKYGQSYEGRGKGLQAGFILLKPVEDTHESVQQDSYSSPTGPPASFVSSALQALKGILKPSGATGSDHTAPAPVSEGSGPSSGSGHEAIYHPPPPLPSGASDSYSSHSNGLPPFKPLNYELQHPVPSSSYGQPVAQNVSPAKLQTMVDGILESQYNQYGAHGLSPSFDSLLASFPNPESSHTIDHNSLNQPRQLGPIQLQKIFDNVNKIQRSDDQMAMETKTAVQAKVETTAKPKEVTKAQEKSDDTDGSFNPKIKHIVDVEKSITYELRGNRIVRLTDGIADV